MTETVQTALITFASGAVGALTGVIGTIIASRSAAKAQMKQAMLQQSYKVRIEAYQTTLVLLVDLTKALPNDEVITKFEKTVNAACLVASSVTSTYLLELKDALAAKDFYRMRKLSAPLTISMQRDLAVFTEPELEKNSWKLEDVAPRPEDYDIQPNRT